ncbi:PREDICTED: polygalacturonase-like [Ipomoea nil]|uniref:polygalacturonase-like n=1 Tax=Ipomoea nil TaxID=35883 RepID=UPI000901729A|nr:PREDICTED: polygalacturonase-like [Ipomoea nil]
MWSKLLCALPFVLFLVPYPGESSEINVAAKPNEDIASELLNAWKEGCAATTASTIVIPKGTYPMTQVELVGPCKAPIELQILGTLKAPSDPKTFDSSKDWLTLKNVDSFTLSAGIFDGQGTATWEQEDCKNTGSCDKLPNNLSFNFVTNSLIKNIFSLDSKLFHVSVLGGKNITFDHVAIKAPGTSHNTVGIYISKVPDVTIQNSLIGTGDDCVAIMDGTENLVIKGLVCGPGRGITVGSLGNTPDEEPVKGVHVEDCKLIGTENGLRIKTLPNSQPGKVTDIHYNNIEMEDVKNPIIINQEHCPNKKNCSIEKPSQVKISKVSYNHILGASASKVAVTLKCSSAVPCEDVEVGDINLTFNGAPAESICSNIKPVLSGKQVPSLCS